METNTKKFIHWFIALLVLVGLSALGWMTYQTDNEISTLFKADITSSEVAIDVFDPILGGRQCSDNSYAGLEVTMPEGIDVDWYVSPGENVLSQSPSGPVSSSILNDDDGKVYFNAPDVDGASAIDEYTVQAVPAGSTPWAGGGVLFAISLTPACVSEVQFVNPSGLVYAPAGSVSLEEIRVILSNGDTRNYSGEEISQLLGAGLTFNFDPAESVTYHQDTRTFKFDPNHDEINVNMVLSGNSVGSESTCSLIDDDSTTCVDSSSYPLVVQSMACDDLQIGLIEGAGQGVFFPTDDDLSTPARSAKFDFGSINFDNILLQNSNSTSLPYGAANFEIQLEFDSELNERAEIISYIDIGNHFEIKVRDEGESSADRIATADNFHYAINELLAPQAPIFIAYRDVTDSDAIILQTMEYGDHTNEYLCRVNDNPFNSLSCDPREGICNTDVCNELVASPVGEDEIWVFNVNDIDNPFDDVCEFGHYSVGISQYDFDFLTANFSYIALDIDFVCPAFDGVSVLSSDCDLYDSTTGLPVGARPSIIADFDFDSYFFSGVENCTNGLDDDLDGDYDCFDSECSSHPNCQTAGHCFGGGHSGSDGTLNPAISQEAIMGQLETRLLYSKGGHQPITWRTLNADNVSLEDLMDATADVTTLGAESVIFDDISVNSTGFSYDESDLITVIDCEYDEVIDGDDVLTSCDVKINANVVYTSSSTYDVVVNSPECGPDSRTAQLSGVVSGTVQSDIITLYANTGGTVTGTVTLPGSFKGSVKGATSLDVQMKVKLSAFDSIPDENTVHNVSFSGLLKAGSLLPVNTKANWCDVVVSNFAVIKAKRATDIGGHATITATDARGCTAPLHVTVKPLQLFIDFYDAADADIDRFEVGDNFRLKAWVGSDVNDIIKDVTQDVNWVLSDTAVATISNDYVTIKGDGGLTIYATYDPGDAEVSGIINSNSLELQTDYVTGLTIGIDEATLNNPAMLSADERDAALQTLMVAIHDPAFASYGFTVGSTPQITFTGLDLTEYTNKKDKIDAIMAFIVEADVDATPVDGTSGVFILQNLSFSTNAPTDVVSVLSPVLSSITMPSSKTFNLMAIGEYKDGLTSRIEPTNVNWVNSPLNTLHQASLDSGSLAFKLGENQVGIGNPKVHAEITGIGGDVIKSNTLAVTVPGPVIQTGELHYDGSLKKGSALTAFLEVGHIATIDQLDTIRLMFYKSSASTYETIMADSTKTWFETIEYNPTTVNGVTEATADDLGEDVGDDVNTSLYIETYELPYQIPEKQNLYDGQYKLVIVVTDKNTKQVTSVLPVTIGELASGDVTGDGTVNMLDVITAFRIASGRSVATPAQLSAANVDGFGGVTMLDVILLFRQTMGR